MAVEARFKVLKVDFLDLLELGHGDDDLAVWMRGRVVDVVRGHYLRLAGASTPPQDLERRRVSEKLGLIRVGFEPQDLLAELNGICRNKKLLSKGFGDPVV